MWQHIKASDTNRTRAFPRDIERDIEREINRDDKRFYAVISAQKGVREDGA